MRSLIAVIFVFVTLAGTHLITAQNVGEKVELPTIVACSLKDENRDQCIENAIQNILEKSTSPVPSLSLPAMDPYIYENVTSFEYQVPPIRGKLKVKNVKVTGVSKAKISDVKSKFDDDKMEMEAKMFFPRLMAEGLYKGEAFMNNVKYNSKGQFNVTMKNVSAKWKINGIIVQRDGQYFMEIDKFDMTPTIGDMRARLSGLFPDQSLNNFVNQYINQNWRSNYQNLVPETKSQWSPIAVNIFNQFLTRIPFNNFINEM